MYHNPIYPTYPNPYMQNPQQVLLAIAPLVQHGLAEVQAGASIQHVLYEIGAASYLAALGFTPQQAILMIEQWERLGLFPGYGI